MSSKFETREDFGKPGEELDEIAMNLYNIFIILILLSNKCCVLNTSCFTDTEIFYLQLWSETMEIYFLKCLASYLMESWLFSRVICTWKTSFLHGMNRYVTRLKLLSNFLVTSNHFLEQEYWCLENCACDQEVCQFNSKSHSIGHIVYLVFFHYLSHLLIYGI